MAATITLEELKKCGIDLSTDGSSLERRSDGPETSWGLDRLATFAKARFHEVKLLSKRTTGEFFRAGHALRLAREILKVDAEWTAWQKEQGLSAPRVWEAIGIYEHFGTEEEASKCGITEAKIRAGVAKPKRKTKVHEPGAIGVDLAPDLSDAEPPPPDDPSSIRRAIVRIADRLEQIESNLGEIEPGDLPRDHLERASQHLGRIREHAG